MEKKSAQLWEGGRSLLFLNLSPFPPDGDPGRKRVRCMGDAVTSSANCGTSVDTRDSGHLSFGVPFFTGWESPGTAAPHSGRGSLQFACVARPRSHGLFISGHDMWGGGQRGARSSCPAQSTVAEPKPNTKDTGRWSLDLCPEGDGKWLSCVSLLPIRAKVWGWWSLARNSLCCESKYEQEPGGYCRVGRLY